MPTTGQAAEGGAVDGADEEEAEAEDDGGRSRRGRWEAEVAAGGPAKHFGPAGPLLRTLH